eukprot:Hpha_TRINITY_DN6816_c0_g2::TRINITY_DN6816_c0_g2_i1::g.46227::m.46227
MPALRELPNTAHGAFHWCAVADLEDGGPPLLLRHQVPRALRLAGLEPTGATIRGELGESCSVTEAEFSALFQKLRKASPADRLATVSDPDAVARALIAEGLPAWTDVGPVNDYSL